MQVRRFEAPDMAQALEQVRGELGPEAVIISSRKRRARGVLGRSREIVEVIAGTADGIPVPARAPGGAAGGAAPPPAGRGGWEGGPAGAAGGGGGRGGPRGGGGGGARAGDRGPGRPAGPGRADGIGEHA